MSDGDSRHRQEAAQLWLSIQSDFFGSVEWFAFADADDRGPWERLSKRWDELCAQDIDFAANLLYGLFMVRVELERPDDPAGPGALLAQKLDAAVAVSAEMAAIAELGRTAHPSGSEATTWMELLALGEQVISEDVASLDDFLGPDAD